MIEMAQPMLAHAIIGLLLRRNRIPIWKLTLRKIEFCLRKFEQDHGSLYQESLRCRSNEVLLRYCHVLWQKNLDPRSNCAATLEVFHII